MDKRLELHSKLVELINSNNVYYQPPENFKLIYPCVIYNQEPGDIRRASNKVYKYTQKYNITLIFNSVNDSVIFNVLDTFNNCEVDRMFISDNLYHYVFTLYF